MAFRRGYRAETELVEALRKKGFYAVRIPISGGRGVPCDIMAAREGDRRGYQVKETKSSRVYLSNEVVKELCGFCRAFGLRPLVAIKWKRGHQATWTVIELEPLPKLPDSI
ncbi:MAG: hypothetical protein N3H31_06235 [Candidatus Nezhaarchaeota archaeon]|nr:hypothetical protein [Candidatus Nezhaarchaeota archaeon]